MAAPLAVFGPAASGEPVPQWLQGHWAVQAWQCEQAGEGLTFAADTLTFSVGIATLVASVDASDVTDDEARLTITAVVATLSRSAPQVGDSMVLRRTGDELRALEMVEGGVSRDASSNAALLRCADR